MLGPSHLRSCTDRAAVLGCLFVSLLAFAGCVNPRWRQPSPQLSRALDGSSAVIDSGERPRQNTEADPTVVRFQQSNTPSNPYSIYQDYQDTPYVPTAGAENLPRQRMPVSGTTTAGEATATNSAPNAPPPYGQSMVQPAQFTAPPLTNPPSFSGQGNTVVNPNGAAPGGTYPYSAPLPPPPPGPVAAPVWNPGAAGQTPQTAGPPPFFTNQPYTNLPPPQGMSDPVFGPNDRFADVIVNLQEAQTGRLVIGAAVTSDAGVTGQIIVDERNFDWRAVPHSWDDIWSGRAFRGAGQSFRMEALPGNQFQRYAVAFSEPFLLNTPVSLDLSGFLFDRNYFDWDEGRVGGHVGLGYRITPDLSISARMRGEEVEISDPRVPGVPELDAALGKNDLYGARFAIAHDTRDMPFFPSQGRLLELSFEQVFGSFDYPRGMIDWRRYFLVTERADGSGRHVLGFSNRFGITGSQTPIYDNFFAGGYSTLRGFNLRGASPQDMGVVVGGELMFLGSVEYLFPVTADDMLKGVLFVDYGTVEEELKIDPDDYRVSLGAGVRINIPVMGPAPIAIDFAVPVAREETDNIQNISFSMGFTR